MSVYDDLDDLGESLDHVERCRRAFEETGNPLYVWEAWQVARFTCRSKVEESLETPQWVAEYFDACGSRLLGWRPELVDVGPHVKGHLPEDQPPARDTKPGAIGKALGFSKGLSISREGWGGQFDDRERVAYWVVRHMWEMGLSLNRVASEAEKNKIASVSRAQRAVREAESYALSFMQSRVKNATGATPEGKELARTFSTLCKDRSK